MRQRATVKSQRWIPITLALRRGETIAHLVEVGTYESVLAAQVAVAVLDSVGIEGHIVTDNAGGAIPSLSPLSGGVRLLVRIEDEIDAVETLDTGDQTAP